MSQALVALPAPRLDAKRIVATSGAIVVHVAILMMLLMPPELKSDTTQEQVIDVIFDPPKTPIPVTPPPPIQQPQVLHQTRVPTPVAIPDPPVEAVDTTPAPIDNVAPSIPDSPPNSFDAVATTSEFQQLAVAAGPAPDYPRMAVTRGIQGTVTLRIHVDASGMPMAVSVEKSSGSRILDEAALKFVKAHWRFVPAQSGGQAIDAWGLVPIEFALQ